MEEAGLVGGGEWERMDFEDFWHCETWNFNRETDEKILFSMRDERLVTLELESFFKQEVLVPLDSRYSWEYFIYYFEYYIRKKWGYASIHVFSLLCVDT